MLSSQFCHNRHTDIFNSLSGSITFLTCIDNVYERWFDFLGQIGGIAISKLQATLRTVANSMKLKTEASLRADPWISCLDYTPHWTSKAKMLKSAVENQVKIDKIKADIEGLFVPLNEDDWFILKGCSKAAKYAMDCLKQVTHPYVSAAELLVISDRLFSIDLREIIGNLSPA